MVPVEVGVVLVEVGVVLVEVVGVRRDPVRQSCSGRDFPRSSSDKNASWVDAMWRQVHAKA